MKEYLTSLLQPILDNPELLTITESNDDQGELLSVKVSKTDMGRVIGKEGQTIKIVRTFIHMIGARQGKNISIKILEPNA